MDHFLQTLAPASWAFPLALQFSPIPLTSVWCFTFCCNVYKAFMYFPVKTNVKNAPPYLHCWTSVHVDASVSHEHECVCQAHSLLYDSARLLSILIFSRASLLESKSRPHSSEGGPPPDPEPRMASAWCGCSNGLKGNSWAQEGIGQGLPKSHSQEQKSHPVTTQMALQQELIPRWLGSVAIKRILQSETNFLCPHYPGIRF